jgi:hypothetical protein
VSRRFPLLSSAGRRARPPGTLRRGVAALGSVALAAGVLVAAPAGAGASGAAGSARAVTSGAAANGRAVAVSPSALPAAGLAHVFAKDRQLANGAVGGVRPGSVRVARLGRAGVEWAVAGYQPAAGAPIVSQVAMQDGAGTGIFRRSAGGAWTFVAPGAEPLACDTTIPTAVRAAWHLDTALCDSHPAAAARAARAAAPRPGRRPDIDARIAQVGLSQVGHPDIPAVTSFGGVDCDPYTPMVGPYYPNPDGRGCGYDPTFKVMDESEEWCADFAEWVWLRAGVTSDMTLINPGANSFFKWAQAEGEPATVDPTDPAVGDAVTFYQPGPITTSTPADHVGIITAVHPDGTVDMVNGDFLGSTNITVQYNTDLNLRSFASSVWGPGEQWVFASPPAGAEPAAPRTVVSGPKVVAAGTETTFRAAAVEPGGSISGYMWAFGDGEYVPGGAETGAVAHHVFADPGRTTVSLTATAASGAVTVRTITLDVVTPSAPATSTPSDALYYAYSPVMERVFSAGAGGLSEQSWDGASWLRERLPGDVAAGGAVAALDYKDRYDVLTPHVFARLAGGGLDETTLSGGTWTAATLPGGPAAGSPITAITVAAIRPYPAVFFVDGAGRVQETAEGGGRWASAPVRGAPQGVRALSAGTVQEKGRPVTALWSVGAGGSLAVTTAAGRSWSSRSIRSPLGVAPGTSLSAVASGGDHQPAVFFVDAAGRLAAAMPAGGGWTVQQVSPSPVEATAAIQATDVVPASGPPVPEAVTLSSNGEPLVASDSSGRWSTTLAPGTAQSLVALAAYQIPGAGQRLVFSDGTGFSADTEAGGTTTWTESALPATPTTFAGRVLLYAADGADYAAAQQAASSAGLPSSQVTGDFSTAWAAATSGDYLVIAVGGPAASGLYYNVCGWANPAEAFGGSTPFYLAGPPLDQLPGANAYENASGATASDTTALASDLAYYAVHGSYPPGVTSPPTDYFPAYACAGSPSVS